MDDGHWLMAIAHPKPKAQGAKKKKACPMVRCKTGSSCREVVKNSEE